MTKTMASCAECLIQGWLDHASNSKSIEIEVEFSKQFQDLTADVICRTAFGSNSEKGKEVFHAQKQLQAIAIATILNLQLPGFKYLPTKRNRCKWKLENKLRNTLMQIIQSRITSEGNGYGDDLLGVMLNACFSTEQGEKRDELILCVDEIIDECKTFFFAGHETTSHLLTWTMFLLSVYPEWQDRLREEVLRECRKENPNADMLSKLKEVRIYRAWIAQIKTEFSS
jgi:cytochrome P450